MVFRQMQSGALLESLLQVSQASKVFIPENSYLIQDGGVARFD